MLIAGGLVDEVGEAGEGLQLVELGFDRSVHALDVGVVVGVGDAVEAVIGAELALDGVHEAVFGVVQAVAAELGAVVGGEHEIAEVDAAARAVGQEAPDGQCCVGDAELAAVGEELGAGALVAHGELVAGQAQLEHLPAIGGDVREVLGVHLEVQQRGLSHLVGPQVAACAVGFAAACAGEAVLPDDAADGGAAGLDFELVLEPPCGEMGALALVDDLAFGLPGRLVRAAGGGSRQLLEAGLAFLREAAHPLADGVARGFEVAGGRTNAVLAGVEDDVEAEIKLMVFRSDHGIIAHADSFRLCFGAGEYTRKTGWSQLLFRRPVLGRSRDQLRSSITVRRAATGGGASARGGASPVLCREPGRWAARLQARGRPPARKALLDTPPRRHRAFAALGPRGGVRAVRLP